MHSNSKVNYLMKLKKSSRSRCYPKSLKVTVEAMLKADDQAEDYENEDKDECTQQRTTNTKVKMNKPKFPC